jgi:hypothetical protein
VTVRGRLERLEPDSDLCDNMPEAIPRRVPGQVAGDNTQLKGRIRSSFALHAFPCQPQRGFGQESSSSPKIFMASFSESDTVLHFFCRLIARRSVGHS